MREYIVGHFDSRNEAKNISKVLFDNGIASTSVQVGREYQISIMGFYDFDKAITLIREMQANPVAKQDTSMFSNIKIEGEVRMPLGMIKGDFMKRFQDFLSLNDFYFDGVAESTD